MTLNEYFEYIRNPLAEAKARVVAVSTGENWTALRWFYQDRGGVELRLSDLVRESAWFPMPDEIFGRIRDTMMTHAVSGKPLVLLGMPGYLSLLTDENKRASVIALREWVDGVSGLEAVCILRNDDDTGSMLQEVFTNPRYRQGKQLIKIDAAHCVPQFEAGRAQVTLVGEDLASFIPEACDTFQKYLRYTEEHPDDNSLRRIVVASEGRELAGLNAEVRQVVCLWDFARVFYDVVDENLTANALRLMLELGKESPRKILSESIKDQFFRDGEVARRVLHVFDACNSAEREVVLWLVKLIAPKGSYLECIVKQQDVVVLNFRSAYVMVPKNLLDNAEINARERREAIQEADIIMSDADIRQFIAYCAGESTSRVAPWLNCGTDPERTELLRRCAVDGLVSNAVKDVYPEAVSYMNVDHVFGDETLEEYFKTYRELKMTGRVTLEFYEKALKAVPPSSVQSRDAKVQRYAADNGCALLVVDAMGAEWMPMLVAQARKRNIGVDSIAVGEAHLPTSTKFNNIYWPDVARRLPDIKRFDNIVHNGAEAHEARCAEENLAAALDVIDGEVLPRVAEGLVRFERVLVTADHGSSRLAVLARQSEPRLALTLVCETGVEISDWRYRASVAQRECPPELEETLDGKHWVVRGYNRLPKKGGGQGFELHGGATLEERLVPVVIFSRTGQFVPKAKTSSKRAQIVEKDDFDL
jgi:hypothetical protein